MSIEVGRDLGRRAGINRRRAGKQVQVGLEIWRDDLNAKGGLLGRPVELVYYDDQANPASAPGIYAKLMGVDKVDLLIGPYSTNVIAAALPAIIQNRRMTIGIFGLGANREYKYTKYFSMNSQGASPRNYSRGFFQLALQQQPKPVRLAKGFRDVHDLTHTFSPKTPVFPAFKPIQIKPKFSIAKDAVQRRHRSDEEREEGRRKEPG